MILIKNYVIYLSTFKSFNIRFVLFNNKQFIKKVNVSYSSFQYNGTAQEQKA